RRRPDERRMNGIGVAAAWLEGRHALVTGAGSGIGAEVARSLAAAGAVLTLVGRREGALIATRNGLPELLRHGTCALDVCDEAAVRQCVGQAQIERGPVTVLVNNAGQAESLPFLKTDPAHWKRLLDVNLMGTVHCTHAVLPGLLAAGGGRIVNVASTAGLTGYAYVSAYCAAKHAVVGFTRALALELARKNVTVNAVCPGYT